MQTTLPMSFTNARIIMPTMWATVWIKGEAGTVIGSDAESYQHPMVRVLFADGRIGMHKLTELGVHGR